MHGNEAAKYSDAENCMTIAELMKQYIQDTIKTIYPKYYPGEVVDFFCELHCQSNIDKDIEDRLVGVLKYDKIYSDASLPASYLYESRGYKTKKREKWTVKNNVILEYEIMEKVLRRFE